MTHLSDLPCWEIMQCGRNEECVVRLYPDTPCWEIVAELGYYQSSFNVCQDCIVYVSKQTVRVLTDNELVGIMEHRAGNGFKEKCLLGVS